MRGMVLLMLLGSFLLLCDGVRAEQLRASTPPRGWNSYDSFSWIIAEDEFMDNAQIMADELLRFGYQYAVVDFLWYRKREKGASVSSPGHDLIDEWGRPVPDPARWPSTSGGRGFKPIADSIHQMGLKFGIHVMRGISTQAVKANTPILGPLGMPYEENGRTFRARDIALTRDKCGWMPACFVSINTNMGAGRAFLRSLYTQYADWGVDFVKHDCIFGDDLNVNEITTVSEILKELERPILYSLSPGTHATPNMARKINGLVNMYRVTADDWDSWRDVKSHFDVSRDFAAGALIGAEGLFGQSWPDLDMLPLGWLTDPGVNQGPHRSCALTIEEQRSQMTLWAMAKSPLMFGGDLRNIDDVTMSLITHPTLLAINAYGTNNKEFSGISFIRGSAHTEIKASQGSFKSISEQLLRLSNCQRENTKNWIIETKNRNMNKVCWNDGWAMTSQPRMCLHWRVQPNASLDWNIIRYGEHNVRQKDKENNDGQSYVLASLMEEVCLDSSPNKALTFGRVKSNYFAPCNYHESQEWELTPDGALLNSYSGLCARVSKVEATNEVDEARAWIANGSTGEIYIAFFNLGPNRLTISTELKDVLNMSHIRDKMGKDKVIDNEHQLESKCSGFDVWNNQDLGVVTDKLVSDVQSHGCALFILTCT